MLRRGGGAGGGRSGPGARRHRGLQPPLRIGGGIARATLGQGGQRGGQLARRHLKHAHTSSQAIKIRF